MAEIDSERSGSRPSPSALETGNEFIRRRQSVLDELPESDVLVLFSMPTAIRNNDVEHPYRQHSDFYHLTGFDEPESVMVLGRRCGFVLFLRPKDRVRETWEGRRLGVEGAQSLGADRAHPIGELEERLADLFEDCRSVHFLLGEVEAWDRTIIETIGRVRSRRRKRVQAPTRVEDARPLLHGRRLVKSSYELELMARVGEISARAHQEAMAACTPGMWEWQLQDVVESAFRKSGARRVAYESIVGSGPNATILHYRENDRRMQEGDLVLIDAGAEMDHYASDITRTFPVGGRFSPVGAKVYQAVLDAQLAAIAATRVGATLEDIHQAAWSVLKDHLAEWGLLADVDPSNEEELTARVNRFYMHRTSHYLGMDVHDVGPYFHDKQPLPLAENVVITIEPGLYFAQDDETVPEEFRGLGVRIEDDVVVLPEGCRILSEAAPKTIAEVEAACRGAL